MNLNDPKFADSAKNQRAFFENKTLNEATRKLFDILNEERPKDGPVKAQLATLLREIATKQMFAGERDENGRQVFKSFEHFVKYVRRLYVGLPGGHKGDRYKHVTEALTYNRLEDAKFTILPVQRSVLQKLCTVEPEIQIDAWDKTIKDTGGKGITPAHVAKAAIALGDVKVSLPAQTASSKMPLLRERWDHFKTSVVTKYGDGIQAFFPPLDELIISKGKAATTSVSSAADNHAVDPTPAPANDAPANDAPANDAPANDAPANDAPANDAPANDAPANDAESSEHKPNSGSTSRFGPAKILTERDVVIIKLEGPNHWAEIKPKVDIYRIGYRFQTDAWRKRCDSADEAFQAAADICAAFAAAGVLYTQS